MANMIGRTRICSSLRLRPVPRSPVMTKAPNPQVPAGQTRLFGRTTWLSVRAVWDAPAINPSACSAAGSHHRGSLYRGGQFRLRSPARPPGTWPHGAGVTAGATRPAAARIVDRYVPDEGPGDPRSRAQWKLWQLIARNSGLFSCASLARVDLGQQGGPAAAR